MHALMHDILHFFLDTPLPVRLKDTHDGIPVKKNCMKEFIDEKVQCCVNSDSGISGRSWHC